MKNEIEYKKIIYKILNDGLILLLLLFFANLLAETILPGLISSHFSLLKNSLLIFFTIIGILWIGVDYVENKKIGHLSTFIMFFFFFLIISNSLINFDFLQNITISSISTLITYIFVDSTRK